MFSSQVHPTRVREGRRRAWVQLGLRAHVPGAGQERGSLRRRPDQEGLLPQAAHHAVPEGVREGLHGGEIDDLVQFSSGMMSL